jgi:hypothetical protein
MYGSPGPRHPLDAPIRQKREIAENFPTPIAAFSEKTQAQLDVGADWTPSAVLSNGDAAVK